MIFKWKEAKDFNETLTTHGFAAEVIKGRERWQEHSKPKALPWHMGQKDGIGRKELWKDFMIGSAPA